MPLPKISYPINEIDTGTRKVRFRPMLVKEEKLLLMAKQGRNSNDIFSAIKQIVNNCSVDEDFNVDDLPIYELEYIFLHLRMASVGNQVELAYRDQEDDKEYRIVVRLDDITVRMPPPEFAEKKVKVDDNIWITLRYPPASLYDNETFIGSTDLAEISEELIISAIEKIYDDEDVYYTKDVSHEEMIEFVESIDSATFKKVQDFLSNAPHMEHTIQYRNSNGTERKIVLRTLNDFFTL